MSRPLVVQGLMCSSGTAQHSASISLFLRARAHSTRRQRRINCAALQPRVPTLTKLILFSPHAPFQPRKFSSAATGGRGAGSGP